MLNFLKFLLMLLVTFYILFSAFLFILPYAQFGIYKNTAKAIITKRTDLSIEKTIELLKKEAEGVGITLTDDDITITRKDNSIIITINYKSVFKFPFTEKSYDFEHTVSDTREIKGE
ncbi:MAG: hypothetical protein K6348_01385 [Deferribacterales bacterium]